MGRPFGTDHTLSYFGTTYSGFYVSTNGYVTLGNGTSAFSSMPLDTQTIGPMIAGLFSDIDTRFDSASQVHLNTATPGQVIVTWSQVGRFSANYTERATFQLVIRSDQFVLPAGEGQVGFFYDSVEGSQTVSAGFGDGLAAVNPGEVAFYSGAASGLNNNAPRWYRLGATVVQLHLITATSSPNGSLSCTPNPVPNGDDTSCTATPDAGYAVASFSGCTRVGTTNTCALTNVTAPATVAATFAAAPVAVPTLSQWALMLLGLGAAGLGARRLRQRA